MYNSLYTYIVILYELTGSVFEMTQTTVANYCSVLYTVYKLTVR